MKTARLHQYLYWLTKRLTALFLGGLIFCLTLSNSPSSAFQTAAEAEQIVHQGIDRYYKGDLQGAINRWQQSLSLYQTATTQQIEVLKCLVRAEQQLGQIDRATDHFEQAITRYQQMENWLQVGRMQTEQAQAYSDLGHCRKAIALLCGDLNSFDCIGNSAVEVARRHSDLIGQAAALGSLGNV